MTKDIADADRAAAIAAGFDAGASTYDAARARLIPCYERFYSSAMALLPFARDASIDVLDLGAGTGLLSAWVIASFPHARLTLIDIAAAMLERARARLAGAETQPRILVGDYTRERWGGPFDAVVSALSVHHCDDEAKRALFARVLAALRPGGVFVNAEQVAGPTPALERQYQRAWLTAIRAAGADEDEVSAARDRMREDRCVPLRAQLNWLQAAGFAEVDCRFKDGRFAVYSGVRPK